MPVSLDVLNTTQADLYDPDIRGFVQTMPFYPEVEKRGKVTTERGQYIEWPIPYGASGQMIGVTAGDETAPTDRAKRINKYQIEAHRLFGVLTIPGQEMEINDGRRGALKLYEMYPKAYLEAFPLAMERYLVTGVSGNTDLISTADLSGFPTLNGLFTGGTRQGTANGLLDFAAPSVQNDTVLSVAKSQTQYHYNQYQESANAAGLRTTLKLGLREAARFSKGGKGPQLLMLDPDSFSRFQEQKEQHVRLTVATDKMEGATLNEDVIGNARVKENHHIVLTDFSGVALEGVGYGLDFDFFKWVWYRKPELSKWEEGKIANQDVMVARFLAHFTYYFEKLTSQVAFAGTARV